MLATALSSRYAVRDLSNYYTPTNINGMFHYVQHDKKHGSETRASEEDSALIPCLLSLVASTSTTHQTTLQTRVETTLRFVVEISSGFRREIITYVRVYLSV